MRFFVYWNGEVAGPYEPAEVVAWKPPPDTFVVVEGEQNWRPLSDYPELQGTGSERSEVPVPRASPTAAPTPGRKAIFIIHGRGIRLRGALERLLSLLSTKTTYGRGKLWIHKDDAALGRYLCYEVQENLLLALIDKILLCKLLLAPDYPPRKPIDLVADYQPLSAFLIKKKAEFYGAPEPGARGTRKWADAAFAGAAGDIAKILGLEPSATPMTHPALLTALRDLHASMVPTDRGPSAEYTEREFERVLDERIRAMGGSPDVLLPALIEIRRAHEAGGDLDTVASNALYAAYLKARFRAERGEEAVYGRDWEWDFVNYHQSFRHLARHESCDIFIPDFPMDAIPDLEEAATAVAKAGSRIVRLDDHHPMNEKTHALLSKLLSLRAIDAYVMSGPMIGTEQADDEKTCGTDLVHKAFLEKTPYDNPGLAELRRIAHVQDLHLGESPLALSLSKLIGSRGSKFEMAQVLSDIRSYEDLVGIMAPTGWAEKVAAYEEGLAQVAPKLEENLVRIDFAVEKDLSPEEAAKIGGWKRLVGGLVSLITGRNPFATAFLQAHPEKVHRILMSLPPQQTKKEARLNVAAAISHLKPHYRMDYYWHAWGGSLVTMRRVNDRDESLDLSIVAKTMGGPGDGGHAAAATCAPPKNPRYPSEEFRRLTADNLVAYGRYLAGRIADGLDLRILQVRRLDPSKDAEDLSHLVTPHGEPPPLVTVEDASELEDKKAEVA